MNSLTKFTLLVIAVMGIFSSCQQKDELHVSYDFNNINNRVWIGEEFWSVPLEDWRVNNGRVECLSNIQRSTLTILPYNLSEDNGSFQVSVDMGLLKEGKQSGSSGLVLGSKDFTDPDIRAAIYTGEGINAGVHTEGYAFIGQNTCDLGEGFNYSDFTLKASAEKVDNGYALVLQVFDEDGEQRAEVNLLVENDLSGIIQLVNNFKNAKSKNNGPTFWFDNLTLEGEKIAYQPGNNFGPVLWTMHTLSNQKLKLTAQFPPISLKDNRSAVMWTKNENDNWIKISTQLIDTDAYCACFNIDKWNDKKDTDYKIVYDYTDVYGERKTQEYHGVIKKDPVEKPLQMGALTCQFHTGFPYTPVVDKLGRKNPDILYFSGDQIYEANGGYGIKSHPERKAINSYLGKWFMFGWAFGDLMRSTPTICTPDDHDIFQGNLWGGGGELKSKETWGRHDCVGFDQSIRTVNAVNRTQCAHLPDPFDPTPIKNGMSVWYTHLKYGRVSFAIVSDRIFKSGPQEVSDWEGRLDLVNEPDVEAADLEKPGLEFLGKRQELFLQEWVRDWSNVDMKVLLSQTVFANNTTHYGRYNNTYFGDLDSGGWPKNKRDKAVGIIRKGFAFQISGDQHLPSLIQYGIDDYRDAGWCFCTPAISICYSRWFRPDEMGLSPQNRPEHGLPNTGEYKDFFGNKNFVQAVGYPGDFKKVPNRYEFENSKTSGFGFVIFDQKTRDITVESYKMLGDDDPDQLSQHPGWPHSINQLDNYGREAVAWLPTLKIEGDANPVVEIVNQQANELEYMLRIKGKEFQPKVFTNDQYKIKIGYPEKNKWQEFTNIKSQELNNEVITVEFD